MKPTQDQHRDGPGKKGLFGRRKAGSASPDAQGPTKPPLWRRLRNYLIAGVVIAAPIAITAALLWWFISFVDNSMKPLVRGVFDPLLTPLGLSPEDFFFFAIPGFGVLVGAAFLIFVGWAATTFAGRAIYAAGERLIGRVPYVRSIYAALRQLVDSVAQQGDRSFDEVVLVEYPRRGLYAIAFVTAAAKGEIRSHLGDDFVALFLPTSPNPTSGYLLYARRSEVIKLDMSVEDGAKLIFSAGIVVAEETAEQLAGRKLSGGAGREGGEDAAPESERKPEDA